MSKKAELTTALKENLRTFALAGVGAAIYAKESAQDLAKKFVAKGKKVEPDLKKSFKKVSDGRKSATKTAGSWAQTLKGYLPFVTKSDLGGLAQRIDSLTAKVDALSPKKKSTSKKTTKNRKPSR